MAHANGPHIDATKWFGCVIGQYTIPRLKHEGSIVVEATSSKKKDKKKGAGKSKSKSTDQGKEDTKVVIEWEFTSQAWADSDAGAGVETVLEYLDPNGERHGGPFDFSHPDTDRRGVNSVEVKKIDPVKWKGHHGTVKIECEEWTPPKADNNAGAGGAATTTPINPDKWTATGGQVKPVPWNSQQTAKTNPTQGPLADKVQAPNANPK